MICPPFYDILHSMADQIATVKLSCVVGLDKTGFKHIENIDLTGPVKAIHAEKT
jgi:hypothetical protein